MALMPTYVPSASPSARVPSVSVSTSHATVHTSCVTKQAMVARQRRASSAPARLVPTLLAPMSSLTSRLAHAAHAAQRMPRASRPSMTRATMPVPSSASAAVNSSVRSVQPPPPPLGSAQRTDSIARRCWGITPVAVPVTVSGAGG
eukprot:scaffold103266_cov66-Phaeocystis_antarctica.AAC.9